MNDPRFPKLTYQQVTKLKEYGTLEYYKDPTKVIEIGDNSYCFFVVLEGELDIQDPYNKTLIVTHQKYQFTGDSSMLSNRAAQFHGITKENTKLLKISPSKLKVAISKNSDISDLLLNAFLLRQETVLNEIPGGIKLIGSGKSPETYAIRDFLEKNHIWHNFIDVDTSDKAYELLENFDLCGADLPLLINADAQVCSNPSIDTLARYSGVLMDY